MLEPRFLSISELAVRWNQTERQILDHGISMRLPLYFVFDGLAFDINDQWLRGTGIDYLDVKRKYDNLQENIKILKAMLARNTAIRRGQAQPSEFEDLPLDLEDTKRYRSELDAKIAERDNFATRLCSREHERKKHSYYGYLRAMPGAIEGIMNKGKAYSPIAYLPSKPIIKKQIDRKVVYDGAIAALEEGNVFLEQKDLLVLMVEVKAIEGKQPEPAPTNNTASNWHQQVRDAATQWCSERKAEGKQKPTKVAVADEMEVWCRNNDIRSDSGTNPSAEYIRRHVLNIWKIP